MKIAFIVGQFPALSATFILNQVTGLLDLGHDVSIFAFKDPKEEKVHADVAGYRLRERVRYFAIPGNRILRLLKAIPLFFVSFFKGPGKVLKSLNVPRYGKEVLALNLFYYVRPFLGKRFDILFCHFGPFGIIGALLKELGIAGKLVTTFHGYDLSQYLFDCGESVYDRLFKTGDLFLPISEHWQKKLMQLGCAPEKIVIHHMGIDCDAFQPKKRERGQAATLLTVGRLVEKKGTRYALAAFAEVLKGHGKIEFLIVGDGPLKRDLESFTLELGIAERVRFMGAMNSGEVKALYRKTDIFVLPSVTAADGDQEGIPVVLMEAMAMQLPVISTLHSGIPELVSDGESGYLAAERDSAGLAQRIEYLVKHPALRAEMGRKGRAFVQEHFNIQRLNRRLVNLFQKIL